MVMELDKAVIARMAGQALGDPSIEIAEWSVSPIGGGTAQALGISEGVSRIDGAASSRGHHLPWSVILKVIRRAPDHDDPAVWDYWQREALAYRSGMLGDLPPGIDAPRCFGVTDIDEDRIALWLEYVPEAGPARWPLDRYGIAARHIGRFNGAYLAGRPLPALPWLSRGRVRQWLAAGEAAILDLEALARGSLGSKWLTDEDVARIQQLWRDRGPLLDGLDGLPRCLCHHDGFRRNLIAAESPDGLARTIAIDWVGVGTGAVGEDLAAMMAFSLQYLEVDVADVAELDRIAFDGYVQGLRDAGASIDVEAVRYGYAAAACLLLGVGGTGGWLAWLLADDDRPRLTEGIIGHPIDEILAQWRGLQPYLLDLGDEAQRLVSAPGGG